MKNHKLSYIASTSLWAALSALWLVACANNNNGGGSGVVTGGTGGFMPTGGTGGSAVCIQGAVGDCACPGGGQGTTTCQADGTWTQCSGCASTTTGGTGGISGTGGGGTGGFMPTGGTGGVSGTGGTGGNTDGGGTGGGGTGGTGGTGGMDGGGTGGTGGTVNCSGTPLTGGTQHCSSNASGTVGSYSWSIWSTGSGGCITPYGVGAAFKATWNNSGDFLAREGFQWNETQTYDQLGTISADYAYTKTGTAGGYSYIGIYGWSNNPLIEYYIVDDWYGSGPPNITWGDGTLKGTFDVDGGTYKIFTHTQVNQPSIHGTATFPQFYSVRQTARQCGHISITEHFKKWADLGMTLGKMYEAKILVEVGGGSGSIDFTAATMTAQ